MSDAYEIDTVAGRKRAMRQLDWVDHGILRYRWHNFAEFALGAYRSNHPTIARFEDYAAMGIKTVLTLRGAPQAAVLVRGRGLCPVGAGFGMCLTCRPPCPTGGPFADVIFKV